MAGGWLAAATAATAAAGEGATAREGSGCGAAGAAFGKAVGRSGVGGVAGGLRSGSAGNSIISTTGRSSAGLGGGALVGCRGPADPRATRTSACRAMDVNHPVSGQILNPEAARQLKLQPFLLARAKASMPPRAFHSLNPPYISRTFSKPSMRSAIATWAAKELVLQ